MGRAPSELSIVSSTSARPSGGRPEVPAKMTSSILPPRSVLAPCSPITQASASTTLDLPEPLGPTMQVIPGSSCSVVEEAKDLKPLSVRLLRYIWLLLGTGMTDVLDAEPVREPQRGSSAQTTLSATGRRSAEARRVGSR